MINDATMSTLESMARLIGTGVYRPSDEDPSNPFGSLGPVANPWHNLNIAALNPQTLPPEPQPEPWHAINLARTVINEVVIQHQMAQLIAGDSGALERDRIGRNLSRLVDDWCEPSPRKWPFPWPSPPWWFGEGCQPEDLVVMGLQFEIAAAAETPFQSEFAEAGRRLIDTGMSQKG